MSGPPDLYNMIWPDLEDAANDHRWASARTFGRPGKRFTRWPARPISVTPVQHEYLKELLESVARIRFDVSLLYKNQPYSFTSDGEIKLPPSPLVRLTKEFRTVFEKRGYPPGGLDRDARETILRKTCFDSFAHVRKGQDPHAMYARDGRYPSGLGIRLWVGKNHRDPILPLENGRLYLGKEIGWVEPRGMLPDNLDECAYIEVGHIKLSWHIRMLYYIDIPVGRLNSGEREFREVRIQI